LNDDVPLGLLLAFLAFLLCLSAFFSGTETALMSVNRYRLRHRARGGHRAAQLAERLLQQPDRLIGLILLGNNLVNIVAAQLVGFIAFRLGGPVWVAASGMIFTLVVLIFAEVAPKTLAALHPERLALPAAFVYYPLLKITWPLVRLISLVARGLLRLLGQRIEVADRDQLTIDELRTLVHESGAMLPRRRHQMLMRILELQDITVDHVMVPRSEIVGIDLDDDWDSILRTIRQSRHTRLPVYRENIDNVVGILNLHRLVRHGSLETLNRERLLQLLDEPYFVPERTSLNNQLVQFQRNRQRTAFVVDEYGDIQGIVTLEDILEEIVGDFNMEPEPALADVTLDPEHGGYIVNAAASVRSLNRMMGWHLPTDGPRTLNGLILEQLEAIPQTGASLVLGDYPAEVLETAGNAVKLVRIHPPLANERRAASG